MTATTSQAHVLHLTLSDKADLPMLEPEMHYPLRHIIEIDSAERTLVLLPSYFLLCHVLVATPRMLSDILFTVTIFVLYSSLRVTNHAVSTIARASMATLADAIIVKR